MKDYVRSWGIVHRYHRSQNQASPDDPYADLLNLNSRFQNHEAQQFQHDLLMHEDL